MGDTLHRGGISTRSVTSGYITTIHHGDGSSTDYWGPTEQRAFDRAKGGG